MNSFRIDDYDRMVKSVFIFKNFILSYLFYLYLYPINAILQLNLNFTSIRIVR